MKRLFMSILTLTATLPKLSQYQVCIPMQEHNANKIRNLGNVYNVVGATVSHK